MLLYLSEVKTWAMLSHHKLKGFGRNGVENSNLELHIVLTFVLNVTKAGGNSEK